jgi:pilus assembly protein CpaC
MRSFCEVVRQFAPTRRWCCALLAVGCIFPVQASGQLNFLPQSSSTQAYPVQQAAAQPPAGMNDMPRPAQDLAAQERELIADVLEPQLTLSLKPNRSKLIRTRRPVVRMSVVDDKVVQVTQFGPNEIEIIGLEAGETNMTLWFRDGAQAGAGDVLRYLVKVSHDTAVDERRKLEYHELEGMLNELFPNSSIELIVVADKLIIRGQARDAEEATEILAVVRGRASSQNQFLQMPTITQGLAATPFPGTTSLPPSNVVSMMRVPGEQQVLLKVRIAEISRTALRELGVNFSVAKNNFSISSTFGGAGNISAILDNKDVNLLIQALATNSYSKLLAEPNLVTLSGQTASFIAGGQFAVPTTVGVSGVQAATTFFQGFGTQLLFTPTVLDKDKIRLQVAPTFSQLNTSNSVNGIPGLDTRSVRTTVDMREGQWLAIAGLVQDEQQGKKVRVPFLGDTPVVGTLFASKSVERDETELLILVSPQLVHPMEPEQAPAFLPGMSTTDPSQCDFYLLGNIEGDPDCQHRSTVWQNYQNALHKARREAKTDVQYRKNEGYYINTAHGYSE